MGIRSPSHDPQDAMEPTETCSAQSVPDHLATLHDGGTMA